MESSEMFVLYRGSAVPKGLKEKMEMDAPDELPSRTFFFFILLPA